MPAPLTRTGFIFQENYGLAIADAELSIARDKTFAKGYYRKGTAELGLGKYKEALKDFRVAAALRPNDRDAVVRLRQPPLLPLV